MAGERVEGIVRRAAGAGRPALVAAAVIAACVLAAGPATAARTLRHRIPRHGHRSPSDGHRIPSYGHRIPRHGRRTPSYTNPIAGRAPDPDALAVDGANRDYYLYSTGDGFPIRHSRDLVHWTRAGFAFRRRPGWVVRRGRWHAWGPSVIESPGLCPLNTVGPALRRRQRVGATCYFIYYTGLSARFDTNCIGVATAVSPLGPFVDQGPLSNGALDAHGRPIGCGDDAGFGNIDPDPFIDTDGQEYLYVSTDIACPTPRSCRLRPTISVMTLAPDHIHVIGARIALFAGTRPWERAGRRQGTVEAPSMDEHDGIYHLFFSGGNWRAAYGEGDATLATPIGPASQDPANPILRGTKRVFSPGGGSTITGPHGGDWMLYHARLGGYEHPRRLFIDRIVYGPDGTVRIAGPTTTPQSPVP